MAYNNPTWPDVILIHGLVYHLALHGIDNRVSHKQIIGTIIILIENSSGIIIAEGRNMSAV